MRRESRDVGAVDEEFESCGSSEIDQVWFKPMSGKLRVTLGVLPSGTGVTCTRRYERRETEVATAAYIVTPSVERFYFFMNDSMFAEEDYFSWS
jgi:hypothetical protein